MLEINAIERVGMVNRIAQITQRIAKIEENFQVENFNADFQSKLDKEIARQDKLQAKNEVDVKPKNSATSPLDDKEIISAAKNAVNFLTGGEVATSENKFIKDTASTSRDGRENPNQKFTSENDSTEDLINTSAQRNGVDPSLARAVAIAESDMNQDEISPVGAIGVMQLMPETAAALGVDPYDEAQNIEGGVRYLRQMLDQFGGNVSHALAAYNAGPAAVKKYGGIPPYSETQNYVGRILDIVSG